MIIKTVAAIGFLALVWALFRLAMDLRFAKRAREESREVEEARGRRVVAEIPGADGTLVFFLEDDERFYWAGESMGKRDIQGARLVLNGAVVASCARAGAELPAAPTVESHEGRERWDVVAYRGDGLTFRIACGELREGVSRDAARRVFDAVRACVDPIASEDA